MEIFLGISVIFSSILMDDLEDLNVVNIYLIFTMICIYIITALIFILLEAEFLALILILIYVGAISIFYSFVILTINLIYEM